MAKYSRDLDPTLVEKVTTLAQQFGFKENGVKLEPIRLKKGKTYGVVLQPNEVSKVFSDGLDSVVAVALYEDLFNQLDDQTQTVLIENLLEQILMQEDKEGNIKVKIEKPQLNLGLFTYHRYGNIATQKLEAVILTLDQMAEQEKAEKEAKKAQKREKKEKN